MVRLDMKLKESTMKKLLMTALSFALLSSPALPAGAEEIKTRVGTLVFKSGYPTDQTARKLYDELDFQAPPRLRLT